MRKSFALRFGATESFEHVELKTSFRSVPVVLSMVDAVFERAGHQKGLVSEDIWMGHEPLKRDLPGLVEIWPALPAEPQEEPSDWRLPLDMLDERDPANRLAQRVAQKIGTLIAPSSGAQVYDTDLNRFRPAHAGDVLILVRTRGPFFEAIIRALKQEKVPVAGADRLQLTEHIAVMDLMAAGHAALLPQDDLTLAAVLKSPLIGLDDDDLLALAPKRETSLYDALARSSDDKHRQAYATLARWHARAALTPFNFYARLLSEDGGRRAMEARLGLEACDALDEFLRQALKAESDGIFSLSRFLADLDSAELEIKRDMETSGDCVRVMTVHAAKGLEAKIVFLPDTCSVPSPQHDPKIFALETARRHAASRLVGAQGDDPEPVATAREAARQAAEEEYRRLLYVALTRAEERLYISGFYNAREPGAVAWITMIRAGWRDGFEEHPGLLGQCGDRSCGVQRRASICPAMPIAARSPRRRSWTLPDFLLRR